MDIQSIFNQNLEQEITETLSNSDFMLYLEKKLEELGQKLGDTDNAVIEYFLVANYIKQHALNRISNMNISELYANRINILNGQSAQAYLLDFLTPITDSLPFFNKHFPIIETIIPQKLSEDVKQILEDSNISTEIDVNLKEKLVSIIIEQLKRLEKQSNVAMTSVSSDLYSFVKLIATDIFIAFATRETIDKDILRRIGQEAGLFNNDILLKYVELSPKISMSMVHALLDIDEMLEHFENGTLTEQEEKALSQQDYIKGLIKYIKENNSEKISMYLSKINPKDVSKHLCSLFKNQEIRYDDFITIVTNPVIAECHPNFKKSLKEQLKPMLDIIYSPSTQEIVQTFSFKGVYELTKLGYISDIDLITTFKKQEYIRTTLADFDLMYDAMYANPKMLMTIEDLREHFTAQRFLDNYFKPKNDNLMDIMDFYQLYILRGKSREEFAEFESEILNSDKIGNKEIIDLFSAGFITNTKMKELKENNQQIASLFAKFIDVTSKKQREPKYAELYKRYLFELVYDGVISQNELSDIIGTEKYKEIICYGLSEENIDLLPENIENISNLGFIKPYSELEHLGNYETEILSDSNITATQIFKYYTSGFISNDKFQELKSSNQEIQKELNEFLQAQVQNKSGIYNILYFIRNGIVDEFELIDILGNENFEQFIRSGLESKVIEIKDFKNLSFIDTNLLLELYNDSKGDRGEGLDVIDFKYLLKIYLSDSDYINLSDIEKIVSSKEEPDFKNPNFTNLSSYIYQAIKSAPNASIEKVKELYLKNYLIFSDLSKLVDEGIISSEEAKSINQEFCSPERLEEIRNLDMSIEFSQKYPTRESSTRFDANYLPKGKKQQITQANLMIEILRSVGYTPKTEEDVSGLETMSTFEDGDLKDYRIFLSNSNPSAVILMHCKQAGSSDIYYKGGESKTFVVATSDFYNYLVSRNTSLGISAKELISLQSTATAYIGKTWKDDLQSGIEQIENMLNETSLEEHSLEGERRNVIEFCIDEMNPNKKGEQL